MAPTPVLAATCQDAEEVLTKLKLEWLVPKSLSFEIKWVCLFAFGIEMADELRLVLEHGVPPHHKRQDTRNDAADATNDAENDAERQERFVVKRRELWVLLVAESVNLRDLRDYIDHCVEKVIKLKLGGVVARADKFVCIHVHSCLVNAVSQYAHPRGLYVLEVVYHLRDILHGATFRVFRWVEILRDGLGENESNARLHNLVCQSVIRHAIRIAVVQHQCHFIAVCDLKEVR